MAAVDVAPQDLDSTAPEPEPSDPVVLDILQRLDVSDRFVNATLELLPLAGEGQPVVRPQVRQHSSAALTPEGLAGLSSSIRQVGQLQPIIVERIPGEGDVLIAGQRRLAAMQLGLQADPDNPHLAKGVRALVIVGPLGPYERRAVQMAENLERKDLSQVDKGRALWMSRVSLLADRLRAHGADVPDWPELMAARVRDMPTAIDDPVERFQAVEAWKREHAPGLHNVGANWADAAHVLGMEVAEETARDIARQYRDLGESRLEAMEEIGATSRTLRAARDLTNQGLGGAVDEINARVAELTAGGDGKLDGAKIAGEAYGLAAANPDVEPGELVDQVMWEASPGVAGGPRQAAPVEPPEGALDVPDYVEVERLVARLREVNRAADDRVRPYLDQLGDELGRGRELRVSDRETLLTLVQDLTDLASDVRTLAMRD